ncbi:MAG: glutamate--tRNA ligase [Thermoanaerobaculia bacterium]
MTETMRVRFAPSPTGFLHVGGARTAIYNDLLARGADGVFILRIEDTDRERSDEAMTRQIREALAWLGVEWNEGPHLQSERLARHRERVEELAAAGHAYRAFETPEELEALRRAAEAEGEKFRYRESASPLSSEEVERRRSSGAPYVVRFRMPVESVAIDDMVRGLVDYPPDAMDDFVLLRSDGSPTYHLSVVVDDIDMGVTHVLRGEDHLPNTPKHIGLFRAFAAAEPRFGHLPLILGPDRKRLSKRTGATSVEEFRAQGILPQALYNFLALLGWNPGDEREVMTRAELIEAFTAERLNDSPAVFDAEKLSWMNAQYLSSLPLEEVLHHLEPFLEPAGLAGVDRERLAVAVDLHRSRPRTLVELAESVAPYFADGIEWNRETCARFLAEEGLADDLEELARRYATVEPFAKEPLEELLRAQAEELGQKAGYLIHPLRMALTGVKAGPPVFDVVEVAGRELATSRLAAFAAWLRAGV